MQQTPNYQLNLVEGTDIVNPLTQQNPNYSKLDVLIRFAAINGIINNATATKTGTVHAITTNSTLGVVSAYTPFKFTAAGDWNEGDSMTLNGVAVTVYTIDGETPGQGIFAAGREVLCLRNALNITLIASNKYTPTASEVTTTGGDSVQDYIDNTKFKNLETWTPNIGENWETFLARIRDNSTKTIPANFIRCTVDGVSGLIFRQSRRTSATSWQYETDYFTGNSLIKYAMSVGSDSAVLRKYDILNGTVQNLSSADAQTINIYGLDV